MTALFALVRAAHFASLLTVFGAQALLAQTGAATDDRLKRLLRGAAVAALASAILWFVFAAAGMAGHLSATVLATVVAGTAFGHVFVARAVLLALLTWLARRRGTHALPALIAGVALALLGLTSHPAVEGAISVFAIRAAFDALHLLAAGYWTGGLVVLAFTFLPRAQEGAVTLLRRFSGTAAAAVVLLLAAGTINAVVLLDMPGMEWSGTYTALLAAKVVLAFVMVALALTNRFSLLPGLQKGEAEAAETLPFTVLAELGAALTILVLVGFLGLTAPMQM